MPDCYVEQMLECKEVANEPFIGLRMCIFVQDNADSGDAGLFGDSWGFMRIESLVHGCLLGSCLSRPTKVFGFAGRSAFQRLCSECLDVCCCRYLAF